MPNKAYHSNFQFFVTSGSMYSTKSTASLSTQNSLATTMRVYTYPEIDLKARPKQPIVEADINVTSFVNLYIYIYIYIYTYCIPLNVNDILYSHMVYDM